MKILQVVPYFYPAWAYGGPGKLVYDTSLFFAHQGHSVTVYTGDGYDQTSRMPRKFHVPATDFKVRYFSNLSNFLAYTYNVFFTPGLYLTALLELHTFDVVHIHDFYTLQNFYLGALCRIMGKPYVLSVHGCLEEQRLAQQSRFKQFFLWLYGRQLLKHASHLIATSDNEVKSYLDFGVAKEKISLLGHGVNPSEFATPLTKIACRQKMDLPNKVIITFLGRVHRIKGLDRLVKAIKLLSDTPELHFVIAGSDDGYQAELEAEIKALGVEDKITRLGTCFGKTKAQLFKASDIFIYPSYSEGFSLGILEAAAAGLPLILSTGCHFDQVTHNHAGLVVSNEPKALAKAILKLATDEPLRRRSGQNAGKLIEAHFSMAAIGNQLLKRYESLI
jgi:glycosyltransferase involved in cell wall biosynthesis